MNFHLHSPEFGLQAYSYQGENLLAQDKCGEAIRSLQESKKSYQEACELAKEYAKAKGGGGGTQAKPDQHKFFRRLAPIVNRTLEKCERENGLVSWVITNRSFVAFPEIGYSRVRY